MAESRVPTYESFAYISREYVQELAIVPQLLSNCASMAPALESLPPDTRPGSLCPFSVRSSATRTSLLTNLNRGPRNASIENEQN
jgi:hypothetical protein